MSEFMCTWYPERQSDNTVEKAMHSTPVLLPGKSHGRRSLVGCRLWGRTESDMTKSDLAAAADNTDEKGNIHS